MNINEFGKNTSLNEIKDMIEQADTSVREIKNRVDTLANKLKGKPISRDLENTFSSFNNQLTSYLKAISDENSNAQSIIDITKMIAVYGLTIAQNIKKDSNFDSSIKKLGDELSKKSQLFRTWTENRPELRKIFEGETIELARLGDFIVPRTPKEVEEAQKEALSEVEKKLLATTNELESIKKRYKKEQKELLESYEDKFSEVRKVLHRYENEAINKVIDIDTQYKEKIKDIKKKEIEINNILGIVSKRTISGSFENSAEDEKGIANILRWIALGGMFLITGIIGYSFYDSIISFSWEESIFRMILVIFLSIPTTYLARESSKHRQQQYKHLQMSLELNATTPYWNSLPKEEQDKLKIELSKKMFAKDDDMKNENDSYPLNIQELMLKIIDKVPSIKN